MYIYTYVYVYTRNCIVACSYREPAGLTGLPCQKPSSTCEHPHLSKAHDSYEWLTSGLNRVLISEGPSTHKSRILVPKTIPLMVFGTKGLKYWALGPSGYNWLEGSLSLSLSLPPFPSHFNEALPDSHSQRVHVLVWELLGPSRGYYTRTLGPMYHGGTWTPM